MVKMEEHNVEANRRLVVIGVGNAGIHVVNRMIDQGMDQAEFIGVDTDGQSIHDCKASKTFLIGEELVKEPGLRTNPDIGKKAANENCRRICDAIRGADMVFIVCGMGGTGSGIAPEVAKWTKDLNILTIGLVTAPCSFEGEERLTWAREGIERLRERVNSLILYPGDKLLKEKDRNVMPQEVFQVMNKALLQAVKGMIDLISKPTIINMNYDEVEATLKPHGVAHIGLGVGQGQEKVLDAVRMAVEGLMLKEIMWYLKYAGNILIHVSGDIKLSDVNEAISYMENLAGAETKIIFSADYPDDAVEDCCEILVIVKFSEAAARERERLEEIMPAFEEFFNSDID